MTKICDVKFEGERWSKVSVEAKGLVKKLLQRDPGLRPTAQGVLSHSWLKSEEPILHSPAFNMSRHERTTVGFSAGRARADYSQELNEYPDARVSVDSLLRLHSPVALTAARRHKSSNVY